LIDRVLTPGDKVLTDGAAALGEMTSGQTFQDEQGDGFGGGWNV
ncbi:hypothetical protein TeGR_g7755, partial [Tetraparma gracilis]